MTAIFRNHSKAEANEGEKEVSLPIRALIGEVLDLVTIFFAPARKFYCFRYWLSVPCFWISWPLLQQPHLKPAVRSVHLKQPWICFCQGHLHILVFHPRKISVSQFQCSVSHHRLEILPFQRSWKFQCLLASSRYLFLAEDSRVLACRFIHVMWTT